MERLTLLSWRDFVSRMRELGFEGTFFGGKHPKIRKGNLTVIIPNKHESQIGAGFLKRLLGQAGITEEEWLNK